MGARDGEPVGRDEGVRLGVLTIGSIEGNTVTVTVGSADGACEG